MRFVVLGLIALACGGTQTATTNSSESNGDTADNPRAPCGEDAACLLSRAEALLNGDEGNLRRIDAVVLLTDACEHDVVDACLALGAEWLAQRVVPRNTSHAVRAYQRACELGSGAGCLKVVDTIPRRHAESQAMSTRARSLLEASCERGSDEDCVRLGVVLGSDDPRTEEVRTRAASLFRAQCEAGDAEACVRALAEPSDNTMANLSVLAEACRAGSIDACHRGTRLREREDDPEYTELKAEIEARFRRMLETACSRGVAEECNRLGSREESAYTRAVALWVEACEAGQAAGCRNAARAYFRPRGDIEFDVQRSLAFSERACRGGDRDSCITIAQHHEDSDLRRAASYYSLACELGGEYDTRYACTQARALPEFIALIEQDPGDGGRRAAQIASALTGYEQSVEGLFSFPLVIEIRPTDCDPRESAECIERTEYANQSEFLEWWERIGEEVLSMGGDLWLCSEDATCEGHYTDRDVTSSISDYELVRMHLDGDGADRLEITVYVGSCPDHC